MKFFSKLIFVIGVILLFLGFACVLGKGSFESTYYEFKDEMLQDSYYNDLSDEEIMDRYEDYLVSNEKTSEGMIRGIILIAIGMIAGSIGIVYIDRMFKKNELGQFSDSEYDFRERERLEREENRLRNRE